MTTRREKKSTKLSGLYGNNTVVHRCFIEECPRRFTLNPTEFMFLVHVMLADAVKEDVREVLSTYEFISNRLGITAGNAKKVARGLEEKRLILRRPSRQKRSKANYFSIDPLLSQLGVRLVTDRRSANTGTVPVLVPNEFILHYREWGIQDKEARVLVHLLAELPSVGGARQVKKSYSELTKATGLQPRTLKTLVKHLHNKGILRRTEDRDPEDNAWRSNVYDLSPLFERIKQQQIVPLEAESAPGTPATKTPRPVRPPPPSLPPLPTPQR